MSTKPASDSGLDPEFRLLSALNALLSNAPSLPLALVSELVSVREWTLAVEMICEHIAEYGPDRLPDDLLAEVRSISQDLGVGEVYIRALSKSRATVL